MKPTRKLTSNQNLILILAHKFRFITSALVATNKGINQSASLRTLEALRKTGYLNRHYNKNYKLQGKAARYYLSKQGTNYLKANSDIEPLTLNLHYKNKNMGTSYIDQCIAIYRLYLNLSEQYKDYGIYSKIELSRDESFIDPKPDLFLESNDGSKRNIVVDLISDNTPVWVVKKRIDQYIKHFESDEWDGDEYPAIQILVSSQSSTEKLETYIQKTLDDNYIEEELEITPVANIVHNQ